MQLSGQVLLDQHAPFTGAHARRPHRAHVVAIELVDLQAERHRQESQRRVDVPIRQSRIDVHEDGRLARLVP
jgi:hypothetical protein